MRPSHLPLHGIEPCLISSGPASSMINIKVLKRQLTLKGFQVSVAMDGRQGLDLLYANDAGLTDAPSIDICLADIMMPYVLSTPISSRTMVTFVSEWQGHGWSASSAGVESL